MNMMVTSISAIASVSAATLAPAGSSDPDAKLISLGERMRELLPTYFLLKGPADEQRRAADAEAEALHGKRRPGFCDAARRYDAALSDALDRGGAYADRARLGERLFDLSDEIQRTPAHGLVGLGIKALGVAWQREDHEMDDDLSDLLQSVMEVTGVKIPEELFDCHHCDDGQHASEKPDDDEDAELTEARITELKARGGAGRPLQRIRGGRRQALRVRRRPGWPRSLRIRGAAHAGRTAVLDVRDGAGGAGKRGLSSGARSHVDGKPGGLMRDKGGAGKLAPPVGGVMIFVATCRDP